MKVVGIIPARYKSSRFQGKPMADILGKPMLWWVYQQILKVDGLDDFYVATDHAAIKQMCTQYGMNVIMTSNTHPTGVDRLGEVAKKVYSDYYILIQGDEPLIEPETIETMASYVRKSDKMKNYVYTFKTRIKNPIDVINHTIIKIVTALDDRVLLASRSPIPYPKSGIDFDYYKSVGVYAYPRHILLEYGSLIKGPLEKAEDHDFMRMLENGIEIKAIPIDTGTISVDTPKDLQRVISIIKKRGEHYVNIKER